MNLFKKFVAITAVLAIAFTVCACHPKNEVAFKSGDVEFTSAYYMCALINADLEARSKIDQDNSSDSEEREETIDYFKQKIDGKKFETYVKEQAVETIKELAFYKSKCLENNLKIEKENEEYVKSYVDYYWNQSMSSYYEPNGVSKATFIQFTNDSSYKNLYFDFIYGKDGEKEISAEDIKKNMADNYAIADIIDVDLSSKEDSEKTELTSILEGYEKDLKAGKRTFDAILNEYNEFVGNESTDNSSSEAKDPNATLVGGEDTNYANDNYDTIKAMATGEVKLIKAEDGSKITLVVKQDINDDEYYLEQLDSTIRHALKDEEFESDATSQLKSFKVTEVKKATKQFKVKKIKYPETTSAS